MKGPAAGPFRALRSYNYRVWAAGALVSNIGTWMQRIAQDWLVLTQLTHHDASALGIVMGLQFAPQLLFLPWTGFAADHFNQRKLLKFTQAAMGVLALALGVLTVMGVVRLWHVYVFAFVFGSAAALDAPVRQTFVTELVGDQDLPSAVSLNSTSFNAARMVGPAAAGFLIAGIGTGWAFLVNGISFAAVLVSMSLFRTDELRTKERASRTARGFTAGLHYVWSRADLRGILIMLFLIGTFGLNFPIFISTMAVKVFHTDARGFGLLSSAMAVGTISGALLAGATRPQFRSLLMGAGVFGDADVYEWNEQHHAVVYRAGDAGAGDGAAVGGGTGDDADRGADCGVGGESLWAAVGVGSGRGVGVCGSDCGDLLGGDFRGGFAIWGPGVCVE
jgi:MFS family permease